MPPQTSPRTSPTPASDPRAGAGGGAAPGERAALEAEYLLLWAAIVTYHGIADHERVAALRNRAMAVLLHLAVLRRREASA